MPLTRPTLRLTSVMCAAVAAIGVSAQQNRARATHAAPQPGHPAPAFTLKDLSGHARALSAFRGRDAVLYFFCGCKWCQDCARNWSELQRTGALDPLPGPAEGARMPAAATRPVATLVVFMGDGDAARAFVQQTGLDPSRTVVLPDPEMQVTLRYNAVPCPRAFVLNRRGIVLYVNNHRDDAPRKASGAVIVAHVIDGLRQADNPVTGARKPATPGSRTGKSIN